MTAQLTPTANPNPAVASIQDELSGAQWCSRYPTSISTDTLIPEFKAACDAFIAAIEAAGGHKDIGATYRPPERAYLMHWCWKIKHGVNPSIIPSMNGVNIEWVHPNHQDSINAANQMVDGFGMHNLNVAPSLHSLHMEKNAIDISISWSGNLQIAKQDGTVVTINTLPRDGMNLQLKEVGRSYGVIKFIGGASDRPHWSGTGH
jgi:hypothetical protein